MNAERRRRLLRLARERRDLVAIAVLEADREYSPDPETPVLALPWAGREGGVILLAAIGVLSLGLAVYSLWALRNTKP
jgi:hypothetical protein